jgi:hypothetical protein
VPGGVVRSSVQRMTLQVLGIDVPEALLAQWAQWLAPQRQPFLVEARDGGDEPCPMELVDTFELYGLARRGLSLTWLDEEEFFELPRSRRAELVRAQVRLGRGLVPTTRAWQALLGDAARTQADGHRFLWWPQLLTSHAALVLGDYISEGRRPSQHREVDTSVWRACNRVLPGARRLAGSFPDGSGPNCFGTVMAAAGVEGAERTWMQREPFEDWLAEATLPGGDDGKPGTVMVWRSPDRAVQHAAVTLGSGWALHKPSQGWMSPLKVLSVPDVKRSSRHAGLRLHRCTLR